MSVFDIVTGSQGNAVQANDTTGTTTGSGSGSADITSNDFLTLLVSELQNQDPTAPTDPNAYITQMVGVNSLQQLISINQGIGTIDTSLGGTTTPTTATGGVTSGSPTANAVTPAANPTTGTTSADAVSAANAASSAAQIQSALAQIGQS
jgi:flagellar basal-body rod modification protein FlgD